MTVKYSAARKNAMLNSLHGAGSLFRLYSGAVPANEGAALGAAVLLAEFTLAPDAAAAGSRQYMPAELTDDGLAAGTASFYRIYTSDGVTCEEQGTVAQGTSVSNPGFDFYMDNTNIAVGQQVKVNNLLKSL